MYLQTSLKIIMSFFYFLKEIKRSLSQTSTSIFSSATFAECWMPWHFPGLLWKHHVTQQRSRGIWLRCDERFIRYLREFSVLRWVHPTEVDCSRCLLAQLTSVEDCHRVESHHEESLSNLLVKRLKWKSGTRVRSSDCSLGMLLVVISRDQSANWTCATIDFRLTNRGTSSACRWMPWGFLELSKPSGRILFTCSIIREGLFFASAWTITALFAVPSTLVTPEIVVTGFEATPKSTVRVTTRDPSERRCREQLWWLWLCAFFGFQPQACVMIAEYLFSCQLSSCSFGNIHHSLHLTLDVFSFGQCLISKPLLDAECLGLSQIVKEAPSHSATERRGFELRGVWTM